MTITRPARLNRSALWRSASQALAIGFLLLLHRVDLVAAEAVSAPSRAPVDFRDRPMLGVATAPVVVVEISNFKCTHCRDFHEKVFPAVRARYIETGKVQWVVVNASGDDSEQYGRIFSLARCAQRQGKYWEVLPDLFRVAHRPASFLEDLVSKHSRLDRAELESCLRDRSVQNEVVGDFAVVARLKLAGTPTFLLTKRHADGRRTEATIAGAQTLEYFQRVLDELLKTS